MEYEDFDVDSLATYLHLTPTQVLRLASRDKIPGRRVGGEWRFSQAEIHHWLEERIGLSDEEELQIVDRMLTQNAERTHAEILNLRELLQPDAVIVPMKARSKNSVVESICSHAMNLGLLWDSDKMAEAIRAREEMHSTALENGVALLHPRRPLVNILAQPFLILGRTFQGVPFGGPRGQLTDLFFLIASTNDEVHLRTLSRLSRMLTLPDTLDRFRECDEPADLYEAFCEADQSID